MGPSRQAADYMRFMSLPEPPLKIEPSAADRRLWDASQSTDRQALVKETVRFIVMRTHSGTLSLDAKSLGDAMREKGIRIKLSPK